MIKLHATIETRLKVTRLKVNVVFETGVTEFDLHVKMPHTKQRRVVVFEGKDYW